MSFTTEDYRRLLQAIEHTPRFFHEDRDGILLRHDIDKHIGRALEMARLEQELGVKASYFFLTRAPLYGLLEPETREAVHEIMDLGHEVGLHCDPNRLPPFEHLEAAVAKERRLLGEMLDLQPSIAVSFHNPPKHVIGLETKAFTNTYAPRFMLPTTKYLSDSLGRFREGDPLIHLAEHRRVQLLIHPIYWMQDEPHDALSCITFAVQERHRQLDAYMHYTNELWGAR